MKHTLALLSTTLFMILGAYSSNFEQSNFYPFIRGVLSSAVVFLLLVDLSYFMIKFLKSKL